MQYKNQKGDMPKRMPPKELPKGMPMKAMHDENEVMMSEKAMGLHHKQNDKSK